MVSGEWTLAVSCLFDATLLWVTARFMVKRMRWIRCLTSVAFGQLPTLWVLLRAHGYAQGWQLVLLSWPIIMLGMAFGRMSRREWTRALAIFLAASILAGGLALALREPSLSGSAQSSLGLTLIETWAGLVLVGWRGPKWLARSRVDTSRSTELEVQVAGVRTSMRVLWDSGNLLRDPVLKRPVIIVELQALWQALPEDLLAWSLAILDGRLENVPARWMGRVGVVEFHSIGGAGNIPVVRLDAARTWQASSGWVDLVPSMVGLVSRPVSQEGRYQALASPDCIVQANREGVMGA